MKEGFSCLMEQLERNIWNGWMVFSFRQQNLNRKWLSVAIYLPLDPGAASEKGLVWNYDEIMNLIHKYNCVKVCLAGHYHRGGCSIDSRGIHHRVLEAALECPPGTDAFGHIDVYDN